MKRFRPAPELSYSLSDLLGTTCIFEASRNDPILNLRTASEGGALRTVF